MHNEKLRYVFGKLGFTNVRTVISSGNVLFESSTTNKKQLENKIEKEIQQKLGFFSTTIIRSELQLKRLVSRDPFKGKLDTSKSQHNVTFLKRGREVFTSIDVTNPQAGNVMAQIERDHGKEVTTRTWKTVNRIVKAFGEMAAESRRTK